jgi:hypothetical protein
LDTKGDWLDAETEELEVYGVSQETTHHKILAFTFEVMCPLNENKSFSSTPVFQFRI